jgi:hypothetical protein
MSKDVDASGPFASLRTVDENNSDVDKSVLSAIKGRKNTDVKIAISSIGREHGDLIFLIRTLDVLIVQTSQVWGSPDPSGKRSCVPTALPPVILNITIHLCESPFTECSRLIAKAAPDGFVRLCTNTCYYSMY